MKDNSKRKLKICQVYYDKINVYKYTHVLNMSIYTAKS